MIVKLYFYDSIKDSLHAEKIAEASHIEDETDKDGCDPYHKYLILESRTGVTSTFRYSFTDIEVM